jgi:hypothetical protein
MTKTNPRCKRCKCLDTTSLTESGTLCMVGGNEENAENCDLFINRKSPVTDLINCIKTVKIDGAIVASAGEVYSVRLFTDGTSRVTKTDDAKSLLEATGEVFNTHFEYQILIAAKWVLLNAQGDKSYHNECGSPVYETDCGSRHCIDKNCMGSYYGVNLMTDLVKS